MSADRRTQRSRTQIQAALMRLIEARGYDAVTIQDVVTAAGVGRSTFYVHFTDKADCFVQAHQAALADVLTAPLSADDLLGTTLPAALRDLFAYHQDQRTVLRDVYLSKDAETILNHTREGLAAHLLAVLGSAFDAAKADVPFYFLAHYLAGAQVRLMVWWLARHTQYDAETVANWYFRLQRAAIREAVGTG